MYHNMWGSACSWVVFAMSYGRPQAPLPENWKPCKMRGSEDIYYFNFATSESSWDHPCDGYYRGVYEEEKKKKEIRKKVSESERERERERRQHTCWLAVACCI